jgi:hypothetical protein
VRGRAHRREAVRTGRRRRQIVAQTVPATTVAAPSSSLGCAHEFSILVLNCGSSSIKFACSTRLGPATTKPPGRQGRGHRSKYTRLFESTQRL